METLNKSCKAAMDIGRPHFCSAGMQAPKLALKPEVDIPAPRRVPTESNSKQKPWSVFGDVFWI